MRGHAADLPAGEAGVGTRKSTIFFLGALIILAFALRLYRLEAKSIWLDEGFSIGRVNQELSFIFANTLPIQGFPTHDLHPPLYFILLHFLVGLAGDSEFSARFLSVVSSVLLIPLFYIIGKRLFASQVGFLASLLSALSPLYLWYAQEIRMYTMLVFLGLLSVYALCRALGIGGEGRRIVRVGSWICYLLATLAMLYTHYEGFLLLAFEAVAFLIISLQGRRWWVLILFTMIAIGSLPLLPFALSRLAPNAPAAYRFVPLPIIIRDLINSFSLGISVDLREVFWLDAIVLVIFLLGVVMPGGEGIKIRLGKSLFLLGYLCIPIAALYLLSFVKPMYMTVRHLIIVSPAYYLAVAVGLRTMRGRWPLLFGASLLLIGTGTAYSTYNCFFDSRYMKDDYRSMVEYVEKGSQPKELIVLNEAVISHIWEYYYHGELSWTALPKYGELAGAQTIESMEALAQQYEGIWLVYRPEGLVKDWFEEHLFKIDDSVFPSTGALVAVAHYLTQRPVLDYRPPMREEIEARVGTQLIFLGYDGTFDRLEPGRQLHLTLYWQVEEPLSEDYSFSFRLMDDTGQQWSQTDIIPFNGFYPTTHWEPGKVIAQTVDLSIPLGVPPGRYRWDLVVYSPITWQELAVLHENGAPLGTSLRLGELSLVQPAWSDLAQLSIQRHRADEFGSQLRLLGYEFAERVWRAGETLHLRLYWQPMISIAKDYQVVLQLVDSKGEVLCGRVYPPSREDYPTSRWPVHSVILGQYDLVIPPGASGGRYRLLLRIYDPAMDEWLSVAPAWWPLKSQGVTLATLLLAEQEHNYHIPYIGHPMEVNLGDKVELLGYDVSGTPVEPGGIILLTLYWRGLEEMEASYKVFIHLVDEEGRIWGQRDGVPANWTRPTTGWVREEVIIDKYEIPVEPDTRGGEYLLVTGMYDASTGERLPVYINGERVQGDRIILARLRVE